MVRCRKAISRLMKVLNLQPERLRDMQNWLLQQLTLLFRLSMPLLHKLMVRLHNNTPQLPLRPVLLR